MNKRVDKIYDVIVIGGGASGMMAAARAGARGLSVLLLEKNKRLGEKLRISGGGRCNILNAEEEEKILLSKYGDASKFLYSLFAEFGMKDAFSFFEERDLLLHTEALKRTFPKSNKAEDVVKVLEGELKKGNVEIRCGVTIRSLDTKDGSIVCVETETEKFVSKEYIVATGGMSHPETGSTGDGFIWLSKLGHTIVKPTPGLVPLASSSLWVRELSGVSLSDTAVSFFVDGKRSFAVKGRILFTHFGLSGPLILNSSEKVSDLLHEGAVTVGIDLFYKVDHGTLDKQIVSIFDKNKNKEFKNVLKEIVPEGVSKGVLLYLEETFDVEKKVHSLSKEERKRLVHILKSMPADINGLMGFDKAIVADGGVLPEEIDFKTMRSKKCYNLFVTGDLIHISRPSGGYSLQLCWSTGYASGSSVCTEVKSSV
jgi:predicted Rossmann fold flavoprotein